MLRDGEEQLPERCGGDGPGPRLQTHNSNSLVGVIGKQWQYAQCSRVTMKAHTHKQRAAVI